MNDHHIVGRFPFTRDGNANRRDKDADPRIAVVEIDIDAHELVYHRAGDPYTRSVALVELKVGDELIDGMGPKDAFLTGAWASESTRQYRDIIAQEKAAEEPS